MEFTMGKIESVLWECVCVSCIAALSRQMKMGMCDRATLEQYFYYLFLHIKKASFIENGKKLFRAFEEISTKKWPRKEILWWTTSKLDKNQPKNRDIVE